MVIEAFHTGMQLLLRLINNEHNVEIYLDTWSTISSPLHKATA